MSAPGQGWFGRKRFGIGFGPRTWQGWLVTAVYALLMFGASRVFPPKVDHRELLMVLGLLTLAYLVIFIWKMDRTGR